MKVLLIGFCSGKTSCSPWEEVAAALFHHRGQDGGNAEHLGSLGERDDAVDDHGLLMAVEIGELKRLVVDQQKDALLVGH
jgi:hypothetical protein